MSDNVMGRAAYDATTPMPMQPVISSLGATYTALSSSLTALTRLEEMFFGPCPEIDSAKLGGEAPHISAAAHINANLAYIVQSRLEDFIARLS